MDSFPEQISCIWKKVSFSSVYIICWFLVNILLVSRKRYSQIFLVKKIYVKMVKKKWKMSKLRNKFFSQFKRCDDMSMFGLKHAPHKSFEHLIILTNLTLLQNHPLSTPREKMKFFTYFYLQQKFSNVWSIRLVLTKILS